MYIFMTDNTGIHTISHEGIVVGAAGNKVLVKINSLSACGQCHARGVCGAADMKEKIIEAAARKPLQKGDLVTIIMAERLGWLALFYGIVLPFIVMVSVLFAARGLGGSETAAALLGIGGLLPYYMGLYALRKKIEKDFIFKAEKNENSYANKLSNTNTT